MYYVTKCFEFEACHHLPNYDGKCANLHGHSYKLEVTLSAPFLNSQGMACDFSKLKKLVDKQVIEVFDHADLNTFFKNPTAEVMCHLIFEDLDVELITDGTNFNECVVEEVKLWETSSSYAVYRRDK